MGKKAGWKSSTTDIAPRVRSANDEGIANLAVLRRVAGNKRYHLVNWDSFGKVYTRREFDALFMAKQYIKKHDMTGHTHVYDHSLRMRAA